MCEICNGEGATYKDHGFGAEIIPCSNLKCQERNLKEAAIKKKLRRKRIDQACKRLGINYADLGMDEFHKQLDACKKKQVS
ncbi:hypothetical protein [Jeotgalibacillus proteolyticus]|uniref:Phage protein n=1 Tax=Jeotgalibacillus proteolyticus TaxID=2082395 RepID=A0A2S5GAK5_9BACL|nr:hypothetical protein [Jeotgalibacillus proteolyticus]PPA70067.1 hypothetical protein C4B60_10770 [Jeotgalibacillus proteolyticus]